MSKQFDVVIIGAGFAGIGMAVHLKKAGIDNFVILERGNQVGGVWRENRYPGAACDVPSHLYSFSFYRGNGWSKRFAPQQEIFEYLKHCATDFDLMRSIRFGRSVIGCYYDEASRQWRITAQADRAGDGSAAIGTMPANSSRLPEEEEYSCKALIPALGQLSNPLLPELPGLAEFAGERFHSANWPSNYSLQGKQVVVIGTGASAIQFVPEVAKDASRLFVCQRSAPYIIDKADILYSPLQQRRWLGHKLWQRLIRWALFWQHEARFPAFTGNQFVLEYFQRQFRKKLEREVNDPDLRQKLTPDYPIGCKRILLSNEYLPTFNRDNVSLETTRIERITPEGVRFAGGKEVDADVIIFGTGFLATQFMAGIEVTGREGRRLTDVWKDGAEAYLGMLVSGFPNMFMLYGPNTNLGHNSIISMLENQFRYVRVCLAKILEHDDFQIDVQKDAEQRFNQNLQQQLQHRVWGAGCHNWYKNSQGKITNNWSGMVTSYFWQTRKPRWRDLELNRPS